MNTEQPLYRKEFPDFDYDLPVIAGFEDESWHNDVCPSLANDDMGLRLWCDYIDVSKREISSDTCKRFTLAGGDDGVVLVASDDIADILAVIDARRAK